MKNCNLNEAKELLKIIVKNLADEGNTVIITGCEPFSDMLFRKDCKKDWIDSSIDAITNLDNIHIATK